MALRSPSSSSSSSFSYGFKYDVFLSFRGSDTRHCFTGNLYKTLSDGGIHTFIDDRELQGGDEITPSLLKAIEESRIAILVFSQNYASSSFCLDELAHIIQSVKAKGRLVLPVFYEVDPSHVRRQTGSYGEALAMHEQRFNNNMERLSKWKMALTPVANLFGYHFKHGSKLKEEKYSDNMERLSKWKTALTQAANLSGHHFILGNNEYEHEFIRKIVNEVSDKINRVPLYVADYPVGLESRMLQVKSLLDVGSDDGVCMVGIYGMGGKGKTALARAIYNSIADQFEGLCFLDDVREKSVKHLQETLLRKTVGEKDIKLGSVYEGIPIIRQRLHRKKVLLILDDVDDQKQLQFMVGDPDWLGPGSRIIITTRDKHLLDSHGVERTYEMDKLNEVEALELLRWKAFKNNIVDSSYECMLNSAVAYASGLPLALEVVGSSLFGKDIDEWKSLLDQYERIPNKEIQKILKVSFDALEEDEKSVFLDISCCFKGYKLANVENILGAHYGRSMKYHIRVLVDKSLLKMSGWWDPVTLHDLIEDMGKEIVRQESPQEPGGCSRLWFHEDIIQVLEENSGTSQIKIIHLDFPSSKEEVEWKGDELMKMKNLKTLIIVNGRFSKGPEQLPNSLRVLKWRRYPGQGIPSDFCPNKLSICNLQESCLTSLEFRGSLKGFMNMKELNLDKCQCLRQIPDVTGLSNLENFSFQNCENLMTIHESVGSLSKLKILNAQECIKLKRFPPLKLTSLEELFLSSCHSLESFPEILEEMKNVTSIVIWETSIKELPLSFQNLTGLLDLFFSRNEIMLFSLLSVIRTMPKLLSSIVDGCPVLPEQNDKPISMVSSNRQSLSLPNCNLSDENLAKSLKWFANVSSLNLRGNTFTIIPKCIKELRFLQWLNLDYCKCLREIRGIPPNLKHLSALHCESLTSSCRSMLLNQELHEAGNTEFRFAGTATIPEWFEHQNRGQPFCFWFRNKIPSIALCVVSEPNNEQLTLDMSINGYQIHLCDDFDDNYFVEQNNTYLFYLKLRDKEQEYMDKALLKNEWNHAEITFVNREYSRMTPPFTKSGIHVFKERSNVEDIQFIDPYKKRKLDDDDH